MRPAISADYAICASVARQDLAIEMSDFRWAHTILTEPQIDSQGSRGDERGIIQNRCSLLWIAAIAPATKPRATAVRRPLPDRYPSTRDPETPQAAPPPA